MTDMIGPSSYAVVFPGFQGIVTFTGNFDQFKAHLENQVSLGVVELSPENGIVQVFRISPHQHFSYTIMTKEAFESYSARQQLMARAQGLS